MSLFKSEPKPGAIIDLGVVAKQVKELYDLVRYLRGERDTMREQIHDLRMKAHDYNVTKAQFEVLIAHLGVELRTVAEVPAHWKVYPKAGKRS